MSRRIVEFAKPLGVAVQERIIVGRDGSSDGWLWTRMIAEFDTSPGPARSPEVPHQVSFTARGTKCLSLPASVALGQASGAGSEAIAHIWRVWGKAIALLRHQRIHLPTF